LKRSETKKQFQEIDEELLNYAEEITNIIKDFNHEMYFLQALISN